MRKLGLGLLLAGMVVLGSFMTASAIPVEDDPAVQVYYLPDGSGVLLWTNLTGLSRFNAIQILCEGPITIDFDPSKTFAIGGGLVNTTATETKKMAPDGSMWRIVFLEPFVTGATVQVYFSGTTITEVFPAVRSLAE